MKQNSGVSRVIPRDLMTDRNAPRRVYGTRTVSWLAAALAVAAGAATTSPSAWATFPGLNGQLAYETTVGTGPSIFAIQPLAGPLDDDKQLTRDGATNMDAAWSADGQRIAFTSTRDGNPEIYVMNADGSEETRLTTNRVRDVDPTWSGRARIAFTSTRDGNPEIYAMNADGSAQTRLTNAIAVDQQPDGSPTGRRIAFETNRDGNYEIYAMNTSGGRQARLTFHPARDAEVSWKPNGKRIAFTSRPVGGRRADIFSVSIRNGRRRHPRGRRRLTRDSRDNQFPVFSPDGRQIAFTSGRLTFVKKVKADDDSAELASAGIDAAWGPLQPPDPEPRLGDTVNITPIKTVTTKPRKKVRVRVPGAAPAPLEAATEIPVRSVINTQARPAKLEIATADGQSSVSVIVSEGRARVLQGSGRRLGGVIRLPRLDCKGADASSDRNRLRVRHPGGSVRRAERTAGAGRRARAKGAHRPHRPHVNANHQHTAPRGTDWTVVDSCQSTATHVRDGIVIVKDLVRDDFHTVIARNSRAPAGGAARGRYVTRAR